MTDKYANLRAALDAQAKGGSSGYERFLDKANPETIRALLADYDRMRDAVQETIRVIESNPSSISDTVWVTGNMPETLLDRCRAAVAQEQGESDGA